MQQSLQAAFSEDAMMVDEPMEGVQSSQAMDLAPMWTDIDELDHADPQAVTGYVEEIYQNCRQREVRWWTRNWGF